MFELQSSREAVEPSKRDPLELQVRVRAKVIEIAHRRSDEVVRVQRRQDGSALTRLGALAKELKARHPRSTQATILIEPQIRYEAVVHVMDAVRLARQQRAGGPEVIELFPDLSLGTIEALGAASGGGT